MKNYLLCVSLIGSVSYAALGYVQAQAPFLPVQHGHALSPLQATSGSIGGGALLAGACATGTVTIAGATTSMAAQASPAAGVDPTNAAVLGVSVLARVSSANTVTVSVCAPIAGTPTAATYRVVVQ